MNKQELLKQADYTFQRGNRELAKKYLNEILATHPNDEIAWMLMARVVSEKERKIECYQRVLKINPNNNEAKIALLRVNSVSPTLPLPKQTTSIAWQPIQNPRSTKWGAVFVGVILFLLFGATTYVLARNNPQSKIAQFLSIPTPMISSNSALTSDIAPETRAQVSEIYPQYVTLVDSLISFAVDNADSGMEGAPERPGDEIMVSEQAGLEVKAIIAQALPQAGSLSSITITEQQVTSWLAAEIKNNPDLPLSDVQVFLRDDQVQIWGMVNGSADSTSALVVAELKTDANQKPYFDIISMQIGTQVVPDFLLNQMQSWLNELLIESINQQLPGLEVMNLNVVNGLITVSGMR